LKSREALIHFLNTYDSGFEEESKFIPLFLNLLELPRCFHRDHLPGHITGSAWIVDEHQSSVLLVHHAKLNKWLQPGGHADGDENVLQVATREANEETGLVNLDLLVPEVFDVDIHPIPARNDMAEHLHYDVRFAFVAAQKSDLIISHESRDLKWVPLKDVPALTGQNDSIVRMIRKTTML
jgi:8-oxo-dGTP pyrophosphatase MutT (NUDIX family)